LVNSQGQVLGMNTSALARMAAITVPVSTIDRVADELLEHGHIRRPYLGLAMQTVAVPEDVTKKLRLESPTALLIMHVEPEGPASKAGIMLGDVILRVQNKPAVDPSIVQDALRGLRTGEQAKLIVLRGGEQREVAVAVGDRPSRK
jgi:S1-C subfamily serine protease